MLCADPSLEAEHRQNSMSQPLTSETHRYLPGGQGSAGRCRSRSWTAASQWRWCASVYC